MNITLSVDDEIIEAARQKAESMGTSVNRLVREYLAELAGRTDQVTDAEEFAMLSREANGHSGGWKFNRDEIHERR